MTLHPRSTRTLTLARVAEALGLSTRGVRRLIDSGELKAHRLAATKQAGHRRVLLDDFLDYCREHDVALPVAMVPTRAVLAVGFPADAYLPAWAVRTSMVRAGVELASGGVWAIVLGPLTERPVSAVVMSVVGARYGAHVLLAAAGVEESLPDFVHRFAHPPDWARVKKWLGLVGKNLTPRE